MVPRTYPIRHGCPAPRARRGAAQGTLLAFAPGSNRRHRQGAPRTRKLSGTSDSSSGKRGRKTCRIRCRGAGDVDRERGGFAYCSRHQTGARRAQETMANATFFGRTVAVWRHFRWVWVASSSCHGRCCSRPGSSRAAPPRGRSRRLVVQLEAKQATVKSRAEARGTALVKGDLDSAYDMLVRRLQGRDYTDGIRPPDDRGASAPRTDRRATCEGATCQVQSRSPTTTAS